MAHEHDVVEVQLPADAHHVVGVALERGMSLRVVRRLRPTSADMVEQDQAVAALEVRGYVAPHVLVAPETVREQQHATVRQTGVDHVVRESDVHEVTIRWVTRNRRRR